MKMLPLAPAPTMAFGRACASAPRVAGKPLAEASSTLANHACLNRGVDGEVDCAHRSAASRDRDAQRGGAEWRGGVARQRGCRTAGSSPMAPSGTVADVPGYLTDGGSNPSNREETGSEMREAIRSLDLMD